MAFGALLGQTASGGGGKRVCRFTVGTSTAGWTANDCDYLCDGTDDQVEINAAIQALPATGGEIIILDGTYNITAIIAMNKDNVTLSGNGSSTILQRGYRSFTPEGVITITATNGGCCVANLRIDGNKATYHSLYNYGIRVNYSSNTITNNTCNNSNYGVYLDNSNNSTVTGNTCNNNNSDGIYFYYCDNSTVTGNTCNNNSDDGIHFYNSDNNTVIGNACNNNNSDGIYFYNSDNNTIIGNNFIRGTGTSSDYTSSQYTIQVASDSSNNLFVGNNIMGKNYVDEGTNNTWANNKYN